MIQVKLLLTNTVLHCITTATVPAIAEYNMKSTHYVAWISLNLLGFPGSEKSVVWSTNPESTPTHSPECYIGHSYLMGMLWQDLCQHTHPLPCHKLGIFLAMCLPCGDHLSWTCYPTSIFCGNKNVQEMLKTNQYNLYMHYFRYYILFSLNSFEQFTAYGGLVFCCPHITN